MTDFFARFSCCSPHARPSDHFRHLHCILTSRPEASREVNRSSELKYSHNQLYRLILLIINNPVTYNLSKKTWAQPFSPATGIAARSAALITIYQRQRRGVHRARINNIATTLSTLIFSKYTDYKRKIIFRPPS